MPRRSKYPQEVRERAVRLVFEHRRSTSRSGRRSPPSPGSSVSPPRPCATGSAEPRCTGPEVPVDEVGGPRCDLAGDGGAAGLPPADALPKLRRQRYTVHRATSQPSRRSWRHTLRGPVDGEVLAVDPLDLSFELLVAH